MGVIKSETVENSSDFFVKYNEKVYNLKEFLHKHPGGLKTLENFKSRDVTKKLASEPAHSQAALYLLKEYKVTSEGGKSEKDDSNHVDKDCDESMEYLVDWSKAMLPQILKMGPLYSEWVNKPVDRPLRLFGPDYLECFTKTPWWSVPIIWIPAIAWLIKNEAVHNEHLQNKQFMTTIFWNVIMGIILWTLLEYCLHRWLFHVDTSKNGSKVHTMHFLLHGLHHKVPFDQYRLVFPPLPAFILASAIYQPMSFLFENPRLVLAGGLLGYVIYDMTHFYLHYGSPSGGHLYHMKRYHYQHHFVHHDQGFGISSPLWDYVFSTRIILKKLNYLLKWK